MAIITKHLKKSIQYMYMYKEFLKIFKVPKPILGRWNLKSCTDIKTTLNALYQNTDHCGDLICGKPDQINKLKKPKSSKTNTK